MPNRPIITLTTDFGVSSPYVAQMKGVLLNRAPRARIVDLTHAVPAQNVIAGAHVLQETTRWYPEGAIHVGVVDPGVGTSRPVIAARTSNGFVVGPDNGLFSLLELAEVVRLDRPEYWNRRLSSTFHGRDIMAPVAAALAGGIALDALGTAVQQWEKLKVPEPRIAEAEIVGEILFADSFGNLMTNIRQSDLDAAPREVSFADQRFRFVETYGQAEAGDAVALIGSADRLELAVVNGNAAQRFPQAGQVRVRR